MTFIAAAGSLQYLQEHFDLSQVHTVGSSGGAFIAAFAKCGVQPSTAAAQAYQLCLEVRCAKSCVLSQHSQNAAAQIVDLWICVGGRMGQEVHVSVRVA